MQSSKTADLENRVKTTADRANDEGERAEKLTAIKVVRDELDARVHELRFEPAPDVVLSLD
ncbi:hypothetical protein SH528x_002725 [Novipirellula sp. SH528]|uniref:hypothetical protein n=1 Tax=Novipirellula sp. SH528 TaxID=3454466 RepID=UPI003FA0C823